MNEGNIQTTGQSDLKSRINAMRDAKASIKLRKADEQQTNRINNSLNLYESGFNTQNEELKKKYDVASRGAELAGMIVDYGKSKGITISGTDAEIIDTYLKGSPEKSKMLYDYTHGDIDPEEFAISMGWMEAPEPTFGEKLGQFGTDVVGGAYDSVTGIPRMIGKGAADVIGWVAKKFGADDDKVNELVQSYKDYLDSDWSAKSIGADTESGTYKVSKGVSDLTQTIALGKLGGAALESKLGMPLATATDPLRARAAAGAVEGAADMGIYSAISESELPSVGDLALGSGLGAAFPAAGAGIKSLSKTVKKGAGGLAEDIIGSLNNMSKGNKNKFFKMTGVNPNKFMNDRGLRNLSDVEFYLEKSKGLVDNELSKIPGRFQSEELDRILNGVKGVKGVVKHSADTLSPEASRMAELATKNAEGGLTMSEINEVKRYFERNNKFSYRQMAQGNPEKYTTATNMDNALREWQFKLAEENGFKDIAELNKETQAAMSLKTAIQNPEALGNSLGLSDWVVLAESGLSPESLKNVVAKKVFESAWFKNKAVDILNKISKHENVQNRVMDLIELSRVSSKDELNTWLNTEVARDVAQATTIAGLENAND